MPIEAGEDAPALHQQIDELIAKRLAELKVVPASTSSDAEFVRRVYLDLTGVVPTAKQARAFLDDSAPDKRQRLIDELYREELREARAALRDAQRARRGDDDAQHAREAGLEEALARAEALVGKEMQREK